MIQSLQTITSYHRKSITPINESKVGQILFMKVHLIIHQSLNLALISMT
jgi:hypothetical protein